MAGPQDSRTAKYATEITDRPGVAAEEATGQMPGPENRDDVLRCLSNATDEPVERRTQPIGICDRAKRGRR